MAILDGRKANDRSWKTVYAVLKSKVLYMYKDKKMALDNLEYEEKPVKLAESDVEVANDYTKRKNVFRVKTDGGSEYLFQVTRYTVQCGICRKLTNCIAHACISNRNDLPLPFCILIS